MQESNLGRSFREVVEAKRRSNQLAFSVNETAQALGVSRQTIYDLISADKLLTFKIGKRRLVSADALRRFITSREAEAGA